MSGPDRDPLHDAAWRQRLAALAGEEPPPADAEQRTVEELKRAGQFGRRTMPGRWTRIALQVAAGVVLFLGGLWWGRRFTAGDPTAPRFALLLLEDSTFQGATTVGHDSLVAEYSAWAGRLAGNGNLVLGEELEPTSYPLGAPTAATDRVTGLFVIAAANLEAALRIARTCPHLRYGGGIVVRPIAAT
jgi:hypothetical protein